MHTKPRTQRSPHRDGRRGDGSHFTVPKSPLGHSIAPVFLQVRSPGRCRVEGQKGLVIPA
jgi:hypothetical protein